MNVVIAQPPNLAEIDRVFPNRGTGVIYAFGDTIYNPGNANIPRFLAMHEAAHGERQLNIFGVDKWWRQYLDDAEFRYEEEVIGHAAEYVWQINAPNRNRHEKARILASTAARLLANFYAYPIKRSHKQAVDDLRLAAQRIGK